MLDNLEKKIGCILCVDDDLVGQHIVQHYFGTRRGYDVDIVDLNRANDIEYWVNKNIKSTDIVILDIDFKFMHATEGEDNEKIQPPAFTGIDVLKTLQKGFKDGKIPYLKRILIATSHGRYRNNPATTLVDEFSVYFLEKGMGPDQRVDINDYETQLDSMIKKIYAGKAEPINEIYEEEDSF